MQTENPYQAPQANLEEETPKGYSKLNLFSAYGRLGRLRYTAHGILIQILLSVIVFMLVVTRDKTLALILSPFMLLFMYILICSTIKRLHDINASGWWILLILLIYGVASKFSDVAIFNWLSIFVSIASLIFFMLAGSVGKNDYGNPPPPNTFGVYLGIIIPIALFFIAIVVAVGMQPAVIN